VVLFVTDRETYTCYFSKSPWRHVMVILFVLFVVIAAMVAFDAAAASWGEDSRDPMPDTYRR
jgi:hypothetical protein